MPEKENAGVEEIAEQAPAQTEVEKQDSGASAESEDSTDYKALYEKEAEKAENYKTALNQKRQLRNKPAVEEFEEEADDDRPLTRKDLQAALTPVFAENKVEAALSAIKDPEKRKLVKFYYDNRIRQTGTSDEAIKNDVEAALAIADGKRLLKVNAELTRKSNMQSVPSMAGSSSDKDVPAGAHKFTAEQVKSLTATAVRIGADPAKFIEQTWKNQGRA